MSDYRITNVGPPKPWDSQHGPMVGYVLALEGVDKPVHMNQKPGTRPPVAGMTMALDLSPHGTFADALYAKRSQLGGRNGGSEDPKKSAAIQRMAAHKAAVGLIHAKAAAGLATEEDFKPSKVAALADWFSADTDKARAA